MIFAVVTYINEAVVMFFFWVYTTMVLKSKGKVIAVLDGIAFLGLIAFIVLPIVNAFAPFYFQIDATGSYQRILPAWFFFRLYQIYIALIAIVAIFLSKERMRAKLIMFAFIALPMITMASQEIRTGTAIQYVAMMVSIVLIFASLFAGNERDLYSTNRELGLATNIQKHMLPSIFPAFPERKEFDIYASMTPAKEVGGDFYDFFLIDEDHLGLVMADVSDKGVPAALFMMASKIMVQNFAMLGQSPKQVLESVNRQICGNNQDEMFVTVWFGILDLKSGVITAANAGHERPAVKQPGKPFELLKDKHGFVVGWYKDVKYTEYEIKLEKGAKLFIYTDGVPEASSLHEQFGTERMIETLNRHGEEAPTTLVTNLKADIDAFVGEANQFDDITMLCIEYKGYEEQKKDAFAYDVEADVANMEAMLSPILRKLEALEVEHKAIYQIHLSLEELFTNIASYAYPPEKKGMIHISYEILSEPRAIRVRIADEGIPFNPFESEEPDLHASVEERKIGGLGLFIVKKTMDNIEYVRQGDSNVLTITKKI